MYDIKTEPKKKKHREKNDAASPAKCNKWSELATVHENPMNEIWFVDADADDASLTRSPARSLTQWIWVCCVHVSIALQVESDFTLQQNIHRVIYNVPKGYLFLIIM